jgi:hypothetical protein
MATKGFKKAEAHREFMKLGLYGKTGSGKTLTALLIAERLAAIEGKRIAYIDTEKSTAFYVRDVPERRVHPKAFDIDILETKSLFEALEAVEGIDPAVHGVVVVDSITALWEAAKAAYTGKMTSKGGIPVQGWGPIKKPYKRMIALLMDGKYHFAVCGREGVEMEENDEGETRVVGSKMKSEGETPYEPHMLMRMIPLREEDGSHRIRAFFEKDRSGILTGKTIDWPNYETIEPAVKILVGGTSSQQLGTPEENAAKDAEAAEKEAERVKAEQQELYNAIRSAISTAANVEQLKTAWSLTAGKKGKLGEMFDSLETLKDTRKAEILNGAI